MRRSTGSRSSVRFAPFTPLGDARREGLSAGGAHDMGWTTCLGVVARAAHERLLLPPFGHAFAHLPTAHDLVPPRDLPISVLDRHRLCVGRGSSLHQPAMKLR